MGFRFQRRIKILPGVTLNVSRSGVSTSIGVRGAHVTLGHGKIRETVSLPGTGVSHTSIHRAHQDGREAAQLPQVEEPLPTGKAWRGWLWIVLFLTIALCAGLRYLP